ENFRQRIRRNTIANLGNTGVYLVLTATYYVALLCGVVMMIAGTLSVGTLAALLQIFEQIQSPLRNASGLLPQYFTMMASAERLYEMEQLTPEAATPLPATPEELFRSFSQLEFRDVRFTYEDGAKILDGVDLQLRRGEITALVGESGIGKSTVIKLILSILTPQAGSICLHCGEHRFSIDAATRLFFSYVPQGNTVLSGTVRNNIAFFRPDVSDERLRDVLKLACLEEFVDGLPEGVDAEVGEHGYGVSEGQAQRIAIARALLNDAPILLLDECTSALDSETEERLLHNLRSLTDKTVLIVSHKDGTVAGSDHIVRLQDGKMEEV
ncbi:MAG: ABC transporter ATP-binding protein, partial [Clostridia bacterium]|nr:ABC transporter ATP-binding protein [Clostridia bacterium]